MVITGILNVLKPALSPTYREGALLPIAAIYRRNCKPKIFTDITTPVKQYYIPHIGKIS
jgi:hypothetical protein